MGHEVRQNVLDNQVRVTTPENIAFQYQLAGPFRRVLGYALDVVIACTIFGIISVIAWLLVLFIGLPLARLMNATWILDALTGIVSGLMMATWFAINWFYGAYTETYYNGQSPGKMITSLRVLSVDGSEIDGAQATLRNLFRLLDVMPMLPISFIFWTPEYSSAGPPCCMVGLIVMAATSKYQRVGDLVSGTIVVNEERKWTPELAQFSDIRVPRLAEEIPAEFVVPPIMAKALAEYVDRRRFLPGQRVAEIASHLGVPLIERMGFLPSTNHDLLLCALYYRTFISSQAPADDPIRRPAPMDPNDPRQFAIQTGLDTATNSPGYRNDFRYGNQ